MKIAYTESVYIQHLSVLTEQTFHNKMYRKIRIHLLQNKTVCCIHRKVNVCGTKLKFSAGLIFLRLLLQTIKFIIPRGTIHMQHKYLYININVN